MLHNSRCRKLVFALSILCFHSTQQSLIHTVSFEADVVLCAPSNCFGTYAFPAWQAVFWIAAKETVPCKQTWQTQAQSHSGSLLKRLCPPANVCFM